MTRGRRGIEHDSRVGAHGHALRRAGALITGGDLPRNACDTIPAGKFVGPACVIDVTAEVAANEDFLLTPARILEWESVHGRIPAGAWVLLRTGWSARTDAASFLNVRADGPHTPGFHADA